MSNSYVPMLYFLLILFIIGGLIPLFIKSYINTTIPDPDSYVTPFANFITNGININIIFFSFNFNILKLLPDTFFNFIVSQINAFTYIPNYIALPLIIISIFMLIYGILAVIPTLG